MEPFAAPSGSHKPPRGTRVRGQVARIRGAAARDRVDTRNLSRKQRLFVDAVSRHAELSADGQDSEPDSEQLLMMLLRVGTAST